MSADKNEQNRLWFTPTTYTAYVETDMGPMKVETDIDGANGPKSAFASREEAIGAIAKFKAAFEANPQAFGFSKIGKHTAIVKSICEILS